MTPDEAPVLDGWLTAQQVADRLALTRQAVHKQILNGDFETLHLLGERPMYVIREEEVEEMAARRKVLRDAQEALRQKPKGRRRHDDEENSLTVP